MELKKDTSIHRWMCLPHCNQHGKDERKQNVFISSRTLIYSFWWEHIHSTNMSESLLCARHCSGCQRWVRDPVIVNKTCHILGPYCRESRQSLNPLPQGRWTPLKKVTLHLDPQGWVSKWRRRRPSLPVKPTLKRV